MNRWGVPEKNLPAGSEVRFRTPSFVEEYRWRILGALGVCFIEAVLIVALVRELQKRRQTEQSLRESEERITLAAEAAELRVWEWDLVTDRMWAAGPSKGRIGANEMGQSDYNRFLKLVHPEDQSAVVHAVGRAMNADGDYESVHRVLTPDGQIRWIVAQGRVEFDAKHKPLRLRGVSMDITDRKEAEARALESERRFRLMADAAPVLIWGSGPDKQCNFFNEPWLRFTGRALEQELGSGWADGIYAEDAARCLKTYSESFDTRRPFAMEYRLRRHDGQYRWILDHGVPRYDAAKNFLGYIGSCVDISERKEAESEAHGLRQELAHVNRVSTLGELAGSLAHELNQPLTAILSNAQAAQRFLKSVPADLVEIGEILRDIVEEDRRASEVIVRMRTMLRKGETQKQSLKINRVMEEVIGIMHSELVVRKVALVTEFAPSLPLVQGDRVQLQQVVMNLMVNACDAMDPIPAAQRRLTLRTESLNGNEIQVGVTDRGPGFGREVLKRDFEPFLTTKPNGLGLGLQICRTIVTAHGGGIWLANNNGHGATVRFTLPVAKEVGL